jgi:hypothetical protein
MAGPPPFVLCRDITEIMRKCPCYCISVACADIDVFGSVSPARVANCRSPAFEIPRRGVGNKHVTTVSIKVYALSAPPAIFLTRRLGRSAVRFSVSQPYATFQSCLTTMGLNLSKFLVDTQAEGINIISNCTQRITVHLYTWPQSSKNKWKYQWFSHEPDGKRLVAAIRVERMRGISRVTTFHARQSSTKATEDWA